MEQKIAAAIIKKYEAIANADSLEAFLNALSIMQAATGGWGEIAFQFKGGDIKESRILLTLRPGKSNSCDKKS